MSVVPAELGFLEAAGASVTDYERFISKISFDWSGGCWLWTAGRAKAGYGLFHKGSRTTGNLKTVSAHRFAYLLWRGRIPQGLELDHLCRKRDCVNPDHLEAVTHRENSLRGKNWCAEQARKTHCVHGHPFTEENTYYKKDGSRNCRACNRGRARRLRG